jgi:hypothetical protein
MNQQSKPLKDFTPNQILQIVNWGSEKLNLPSNVLEQETTKIIFEQGQTKSYLVGVDVNGMLIKA